MAPKPKVDLDLLEDRQKAANKKQAGSEKAKLAQQKYYLSDKGKKAHEAQNNQVKLFRKYGAYLKTIPPDTEAMDLRAFEKSLTKKTKKAKK